MQMLRFGVGCVNRAQAFDNGSGAFPASVGCSVCRRVVDSGEEPFRLDLQAAPGSFRADLPDMLHCQFMFSGSAWIHNKDTWLKYNPRAHHSSPYKSAS